MEKPSKEPDKPIRRAIEKAFWEWVQEHVRPDFGWDAPEDEGDIGLHDMSDRWHYFIHRVRVGFKLVWKF